MKKLIVPIFFTGLCLISAGILYARAYSSVRKNQLLTTEKVTRDLSIAEVRQTNIVPEGNVDYSLVYTIRTFRYTEGLRIKEKKDTLNMWVSASPSCRCTDAPKPGLPKPFKWGTLKP